MTEKGLINLKNCYEENSTIQHSLDYYISYIRNKNENNNKTNEKVNNNDNDNNNENNDNNNKIKKIEKIEKQEKTIIYNYLKKMWSKREINIIIQLFQEYNEKKSIN